MSDSKEIADVLKHLKSLGASVSNAEKPSDAGTSSEKLIEDLSSGVSPNFGAWVSWSKSF